MVLMRIVDYRDNLRIVIPEYKEKISSNIKKISKNKPPLTCFRILTWRIDYKVS